MATEPKKLCDACRHDLEALIEIRDKAEELAATAFRHALDSRMSLDEKLDEACDCLG